MIEFDDDVNQFVKIGLPGKLLMKLKKYRRKFKLPKLGDDKLTTRFYFFVCLVVFAGGWFASTAYVIPAILPHKPVYIPESSPTPMPNNPTIQPSVNPESDYYIVTQKPTVKPGNPTPIHLTDSIKVKGITETNESIPTVMPVYTGDDYNKMKANDGSMIYTENLALNIYNQTDLGYKAYHVNDKAQFKLNTFNMMDEPVTNLKAYLTVSTLTFPKINLVERKLVYDGDVIIESQQNYLSVFNLNIPNYKGNYGLTLEVEGNDKKGYGLYWEVDII